MFPQNLLVSDTSVSFYYQRIDRVPVRNLGHDWSLPVDGSTMDTEWQGLHPARDHLQVLNPESGYMQNCNIPPNTMIPDSPFRLDAQPGYLFSSAVCGTVLGGWTNQQAARAIKPFSQDRDVTVPETLASLSLPADSLRSVIAVVGDAELKTPMPGNVTVGFRFARYAKSFKEPQERPLYPVRQPYSFNPVKPKPFTAHRFESGQLKVASTPANSPRERSIEKCRSSGTTSPLRRILVFLLASKPILPLIRCLKPRSSFGPCDARLICKFTNWSSRLSRLPSIKVHDHPNSTKRH